MTVWEALGFAIQRSCAFKARVLYVAHRVCSACNYGSHVGTAEVDDCVQRDHHYADIQLLARTMFFSSGSPISSQRLLCYATPQAKSETNTTKLDER